MKRRNKRAVARRRLVDQPALDQRTRGRLALELECLALLGRLARALRLRAVPVRHRLLRRRQVVQAGAVGLTGRRSCSLSKAPR